MRKFASSFLVFSLLALSGNLFAKERRGAELIVQKKDGEKVRGELIAVKQNSLLLLDTEGADVSIDISDISVIRIVKKSKALLGLFSGGLAGGVLMHATTPPPQNAWEEWDREFEFVACVLLGSLVGLWLGALAGVDETIEIEKKLKFEVKEALEKLRKKARIPDYQ